MGAAIVIAVGLTFAGIRAVTKYVIRHVGNDLRKEVRAVVIDQLSGDVGERLEERFVRLSQPWVEYMNDMERRLEHMEDHHTEHQRIWQALASLGYDRRIH